MGCKASGPLSGIIAGGPALLPGGKMDRKGFESTFHHAAPPDELSEALRGLWWDRRNDWDAAHTAVQAGSDVAAAWVHAYLHRKEGDLPNSDYWYQRAGRKRPAGTLDEEWSAIVDALVDSALGERG